MPRSTLYVTLLKKLIEATKQEDRDLFYQVVEEIHNQLGELDEDERFDLLLNIKSESKAYENLFL